MQTVNNIVAFLQGKKTYILAVLGIVTVALKHYGYISADLEQQALLVLGFGSVASLRAGIANLVQGQQATQ